MNAASSDSSSPLYWAISQNKYDIFETLIKHGAKVDSPSSDPSLLIPAIKNENMELVHQLLNLGVALVSSSNNATDPFMLALSTENEDLLDLLFKYEKKFTKNYTVQSMTSLHSACRKSDGDPLIKEAIKRGVPVDVRDEKNNTPLHYLTTRDGLEVSGAMRYLVIEKGAKVDLRNNEGFTPIEIATLKESAAVAKFLLTNKGNQNISSEDVLLTLDCYKTGRGSRQDSRYVFIKGEPQVIKIYYEEDETFPVVDYIYEAMSKDFDIINFLKEPSEKVTFRVVSGLEDASSEIELEKRDDKLIFNWLNPYHRTFMCKL